MESFRLALVQINPTVGDLDGNIALIKNQLERLQDCDLAVFGEMSVTGYPLEDLVLKPGFVADNRAALQKIAEISGNCATVVGFVDSDDENVYNAIAICHEGEIVGTYRKQNLPNVEVFDEVRNFSSGNSSLNLFCIGGVSVGFAICEDLWAPKGPIELLRKGGAELIVVSNGSPFHQGKQEERETFVSEKAISHGLPIAYVNLVGGQDELVFDGGSFISDPHGEIITSAPRFQEALVIADLEIKKSKNDKNNLPIKEVSGSQNRSAIAKPFVSPQLGELEELYMALVLSTRDYVKKSGFNEVCLGLSGGIDSALVATIAADALGAKSVHAVLMPSRYSSDHSITDAENLTTNLGISSLKFPIEDIHKTTSDQWGIYLDSQMPGLADENLQSRIRGVLLMALSNAYNLLVLTTGNKSEAAVGYSTLYGDTAGAFAVIKDVYKTSVYELANWRNESTSKEIIPSSIINKAPSAELRPEQRDDQSLPPYEILDPLLKAYIEGDRTRTELIQDGFDPGLVDGIVNSVDKSEYKRRQNPPGVRVTRKGFGRDRRLPIVNKYSG